MNLITIFGTLVTVIRRLFPRINVGVGVRVVSILFIVVLDSSGSTVIAVESISDENTL